jgi:hypothetical protein
MRRSAEEKPPISGEHGTVASLLDEGRDMAASGLGMRVGPGHEAVLPY